MSNIKTSKIVDSIRTNNTIIYNIVNKIDMIYFFILCDLKYSVYRSQICLFLHPKND